MSASLVAKYEQILSSDPRSRIFVELARALVDSGEVARAIEICRHGLEHHPQSILGRVIWGRALLASGDVAGARDQFEVGIAIDPANPYAYNLVGEAMVKAGLWREALPVLTRAVELQPADAKVKGWLEDARRRAQGGTVPAMAAQAEPPAPHEPEAAPPAAGPGEGQPPVAAARATRLAVEALPDEPGPGFLDEPEGAPPAPPAAAASDEPTTPTRERTDAYRAPAPDEDPDATEEMTLHLSLDATAEDEPLTPPRPPPPGTSSRPTPPAMPAAAPAAQAPPGAPGPDRPPRRGPPGPRTVLNMIPSAEAAAPDGASAAPAGPAPDAHEATRIALAYEQELREKAARTAAHAEPPPSRHRGLWALLALAAVLGLAAFAYFSVQARARNEAAARAVEAARTGLARDTKASLQKAAEVLAAARAEPPTEAELARQVDSLSAQVAALLAAEHGDDTARALARSLSGPGHRGDGVLAARWLLAGSASERAEATDPILTAPPAAGPLVQRLAGLILLSRGEAEAGRGRLQVAARATPPLLGALADLGEERLQAGDPEGALPFFEAAIAAHPTHPRAVVGAAEARLALERPLDGSRKELEAVDHDPGSAPPRATRLRYELAFARVLGALGDAHAASHRLQVAAGELGDSAGLEAARAGLLLDARDFAGAEEAAARAVRLEPGQAAHRVVLARARLGRHRAGPALEALAAVDTREAWLVRGAALLSLGHAEQARSALEKTMRNGKMTTEAATWYGLGDLALGRTERAISLLEKLAAVHAAGAFQHAALGRALLAEQRTDEAEAACQKAAEEDGHSPEGPRCLGLVLLATGRKGAAASALEEAARLDPADPEIARALASARAAPPRPVAKPAPAPPHPVAKVAPRVTARPGKKP